MLSSALLGFSLNITPAFAGLSFSEALTAAEANAPELAGRRHAIVGAESARRAADSLPDPRLVLGLDNVPVDGPDRGSLDNDFMTMRRIGFMQDVPNSAKRQARADVATATADRTRAELAVERVMVRRDVALAWITRYYLERQLALFDELERENNLLTSTARAQISSGQGMPADSTMARQEVALLADRRDDLTRDVARAKAALVRFIGERANDALVGAPPALSVDAANLRAHLHNHPELAVYQPMAEQAAADTREAEASRRPDWGVELAYQQRGPEFSNMVSLQFSFDLPLFSGSRQDPRIAAKLQEEQRIASEREAMQRKHIEELDGLLADYTALSQKLARTRETLLPLAHEKVELMLASYRAGKTNLTQTLTARRESVETQLKAIALEAELATASAKLIYFYGENRQ
ncbi:MAG: TolC family protein [Gammaproteobacteria bacterium]|nr:TolC family protein [Gammaproteobacteria bacterium]